MQHSTCQMQSLCTHAWSSSFNLDREPGVPHGYIPEEYIHALNPYPLRIRAGDTYSKCMMRKRGEDISILSVKNCKIMSDPYSRYGRQDTGIYKIIKLLGPTEFRYNAVYLSFPNPTIGRFMCRHVVATSGIPARPGKNH